MKLRVGTVCLLTAFAIAAQASSALAAAAEGRPAYDARARDDRGADRRYDDRRADDRRAEDRRDDRYADDRYGDRVDARYDDRSDDRYADGRYGDARDPYPYVRRPYDEPVRSRYCGMHNGRRAPAIMTYDQTTGTQVLVDNDGGGVKVTGRNDETASAFAVDGDLSQPNVPYMCAADDQTGDAYEIDAYNGDYDATVRGIDADTGRRWSVTGNPDGRGPQYDTYDPYTGCAARTTMSDGGRARTEAGPYDSDHRRFVSDFFAGSATGLGVAAAATALSGGSGAGALAAGAVLSAGVSAANAPC
ncbi:hypothetical protein [Caulobacter sp. 17J80-11]|uniref:hypothetical protein n=1 Tax=Caulobacter sp. 17J80-11 TaxID=2763502 RepID=UPI00165388DC|nr:hypothetical protein [Caulobacter sp. 17J80-11]MBC6980541.1 hypothetical protein [Caulobacter sp. 17J80-11]